jgi:hypothetical protein
MPSQKYLFLHRTAPSQQQGSSREQPSLRKCRRFYIRPIASPALTDDPARLPEAGELVVHSARRQARGRRRLESTTVVARDLADGRRWVVIVAAGIVGLLVHRN